MSTATEEPGGRPPPGGQDGEGWREVRFRHSPSFVEVLDAMRCTLLVSTYQAGKLIAVGVADGRLELGFHEFDQAMGVAAGRGTIAVGTRGEVFFLRDNSRIARSLEPAGRYDRCYLARTATVTGRIQCHELAWGRDAGGEPELWVANTLFSCLANVSGEYSFVPRWRPPFVSRLAPEDRCHLNGIAMRDGRPASVTVMGRTDEAGGWRADKNGGGCVLDVESGEAVTTGLAMPHSPRWYRGRLYVLNSGWGTLEAVDPATGDRARVETVPGFTRGLAFRGNLAFVGLSRIRETAVFGGVPIADRRDELKCGVGVIDLDSGTTVATLEFETGVEEIFDVQVLPDTRCVALSAGRAGAAGDIWVVPQPGTTGPGGEDAAGLVERALAAQRHGRAREAVALLEQAAAAQPRSAATANHLGNALQDVGDREGALAAYRRAVAAEPGFAPAHQNLGYLLVSRGDTEAGVAHLREAQRAQPSDVNRLMIATGLPVIYTDEEHVRSARRRMLDDVQALVEDGAEIDTTDTMVPTNFLAAYQGENDRELHAHLGRIHRGPDLVGERARRPRDGRPRIGILSAYLRDHTIGRLNLGRVQRLSRERFEVVVLSATRARDPIAEAFRAAADEFVHVPRDVAAARRLIADQALDALLFTDVGMDALTYTLAFSRMAPVQCATWGHPVTTGSPTMDHFISSELLEVPGAEAHYTERLARLPSLGTYYHRPERPDVHGARERLGLPEANLYACPQTLFKFHPAFDPLLAGILRADPDGALVMIEAGWPTWTELLRERLSRTMPDVTDRILWLAPLPHEDYLRLLATADVVLDPIHFGGGNSSYEALAMGTPVVTLPGDLLRSRITRALYAKAGYEDLVAGSPDEYVEIAVRLGRDPAHRAAAERAVDERCGVLYEDDEEVRDLERFLASVVG